MQKSKVGFIIKLILKLKKRYTIKFKIIKGIPNEKSQGKKINVSDCLHGLRDEEEDLSVA